MIYIYADGASKGNPGPGGFGVAVLENVNITNIYSKQYPHITNNQGELKGLLFALALATTQYKNEKVTIYSDSAYCVNMFNDWIHTWAGNGWKNSKKQTVENIELVQQLYTYASIEFPWFSVEKVKGHCGIIGNELADAAASNNKEKLEKLFLENKDNLAKCKIFDF